MKSWPWKKIIIAFIFLGLMGTLWQLGLNDIFSLQRIQSSAASLQSFTHDHYLLAILTYLGCYIAALCLFLPVAAILTLTGGFLFGTVLGGILAITGATSGAVIIFLVARSAFGASLRKRAGNFYLAAEKEMQQGAVSYLLFMRLVPVFPFALSNIVPALFNIRLRVFLWTTALGITPIAFIYANLGQTLATIRSLHDLFSPKLALALALLGLTALIPVVLRKIRPRKA